jgi:hypothetical protein
MSVEGFLARNDVQLIGALDVLGYRPVAAMELAPAA